MTQTPQTQYEQEINAHLVIPRRPGGLALLANNRLAQQFERIRRKLQGTNTSSGAAVVFNPTLPKQVLTVSATQTASKQQDRTFSLVSVSFTRDASDPNFAGVRIWFKGYKGNSQWELVASGTDSPVSFLEEATGETVQVAVQAFNQSGFAAAFAGAPITTVKLSGVVSAPPAPTVTQNATPVVGGFQFTFSIEGGLLADVIDCYKVYRNTVNVSGSATVCQTIKHPQSNNGSYIVQDYPGGDSIYFYWVSAVNTVGLESSLTAAQSSTNNALANQQAFGKNLVPNPGFENNTLGVAYNTNITLQYPICDGWIFSQNDSSLFFVQLSNASAHSGNNRIEVGWTPNTTIAANGLAAGSALSTGKLPLQINDIIRVSGWYEMAVNSVPAGVLTFARILVNCYSQSGANLGAVVAAQTQTPTASWTQIQAAVQIPATLGGGVPAWGQIVCQLFLQNTNGTTQTLPISGFANAFFDDVRVVIQNTAFDLTPLNTQGLPQTNGKILSQSGTTSTINVASFTMQYGDGTITYNSGSVNPGSLGTWYVYFLDPTYSGGAVTYLTTQNAYITTSDNGAEVIGQITTVGGGGATGGTGGGGTTITICFSPDVKLKYGRAIGDIKEGDAVLTSEGYRRVSKVQRRRYAGEMCVMGNGGFVTLGHLFRVGKDWHPAHELFPQRTQYSGEVVNLEIDTEVEDERNYILENGLVAHNIRPGGTC